MARTRAVALAALAFALPSCSGGEKLAPVSGSVLVDGKPAVGAVLVFHPEGPPDANTVAAFGQVGADGSFQLRTGEKLGTKPGNYIVTVRWPDPKKKFSDVERMRGASVDDAPDLLKGRFATKDKSTLKAEVKPGENTLKPFNIK